MSQQGGVSHNGPQLYSLIHKGIRDRLFKFSIAAGKMDYADASHFQSFSAEANSLVENIRLHHDLEEKFIHPLINDRMPGGTVKLEEEHQVVLKRMNELLAHLEGIKRKTAGFERQKDLSLEFYLAYNRFLFFFLAHLDDEEEHMQRALFDLCTLEELGGTFARVTAAQKPEELQENLKMILSGANIDDLTGLFIGAKVLMPTEGYNKVVRLGETILSPDVWSVVKRRASIG